MCTINLTWEEIKAAMRLDDVLGVKTALESCYREPPMPPNQRATALGYFITMAISGTHYDRDPAQNSERAIRFGITHHEALELDLQTFVDFVAYDVLKYPELSILEELVLPLAAADRVARWKVAFGRDKTEHKSQSSLDA